MAAGAWPATGSGGRAVSLRVTMGTGPRK
jgi:hypothetical protein